MKRLKRVHFVRPNLGDYRSRDAMEPLVAALLKGLTPPGIDFTFCDERLEPVDLCADADLVALTVETFTARRAYEIADAFRRRGVSVVMGGYHPTFCPDEALRHADAIVLGDAETTWPRLLEDFDAGRLQRLYRDAGGDRRLHAAPDHSVYEGKRYATLSLVQHGRGCRFACEFCSIRAFYGSRRASHTVEATARAFAQAAHSRVFFVDDNLFESRRELETLLRVLIRQRAGVPPGERKQWCCQVSLDVTRDPALLDLMAESGCFLAVVGFESLARGNLREMGKRWNGGRHVYEGAIRRLHERGILIYGTFVFGYGEDTPAVIRETVDFARTERLAIANFNPLTPTPGSPLYDRLHAEGRLLHPSWWLAPDYRYGQAVFRPRAMTPEELEEGCLGARMRFYSPVSIAARLLARPPGPGRWRNLGVSLAANLISRAEIRNKQGRPLGAFGPAHAHHADQA